MTDMLTSLLAAVLVAGLSPVPAADPACAAPTVPGAERQLAACLSDLTTAGTVATGAAQGCGSAKIGRPSMLTSLRTRRYSARSASVFRSLHRSSRSRSPS